MDKLVSELSRLPYSEDDIMNALEGKSKIVSYNEISKFRNLDDLLQPYDSVVLLYTTKENFGHWITIFKVGKRAVEFFDPYGYYPDDELELIPDEWKYSGHSGEEFPYLSRLLDESGYQVIYNGWQLQGFKKDINTCGRWCVLRNILKQMRLDDFVKLFLNQRNPPDFYPTIMLSFIK